MENRARNNTPYGLPVVESCFTCVLREERLLCQLSPTAQAELDSLRQTASYPQGALLFVEGEPSRGLLIVCAGKAKLAVTSREGKSITLRVVLPGEVMGLSSVMANCSHQTSASTLEPSQISMIPRSEFLWFLHRHNEAALRVAEHLSMELHKAWEQTRLIALAPNARAKMARLLLLWAEHHSQTTDLGVRVPMNMTHEAVGESIGATRETVSRLLADFQRRRLIQITGGSVLLLNLQELRGICAVDSSRPEVP